MPEDNESKPRQQSFIATPSTKALALVSVAIIIGLFLVMIVDADGSNSSKKNANATGTTTTTTTTAPVDNNNSSSSTTTTTAKTVTGAHDPSLVKVLVLNGGDLGGVAGEVTDALEPLKYDVLSPGDDSSKAKGTIVYYKSGYVNDAKQLATNVLPNVLDDLNIVQTVKTQQFPASAPSVWAQTNLASANVVVVVGNAS